MTLELEVCVKKKVRSASVRRQGMLCVRPSATIPCCDGGREELDTRARDGEAFQTRHGRGRH